MCGCVRLGVAGGSQYTTSCEPPCGLAVLLGKLVKSLFKTLHNPLPGVPFIPYATTVGERSNFKKIPTHTQDHGDA